MEGLDCKLRWLQACHGVLLGADIISTESIGVLVYWRSALLCYELLILYSYPDEYEYSHL